MDSHTDRLVRELHAELMRRYGEAGDAEVVDHLAWEVGAAACELVRPARWVAQALVATGLCVNPSEAHARVARILSDYTSSFTTPDIGHGFPGLPADMAPSVVTIACPEAPVRQHAVMCMEAELPTLSLPLQARLESCPVDELDQAATSVIAIAMETGDAALVEDVVVSLLIFSDRWDAGGRWWADQPGDPAPTRPAIPLH